MVQTTGTSSKNLWVAASDGDIDRVRALIETQGYNANSKDSNSYTPMHAAASYAHIELLEYLLSIGGDINVPDAEGDTPLFTVESVEMARWMLDHGADATITNEEGLTAAETLEEDHPEISAFLNGTSGINENAVDHPAPHHDGSTIPLPNPNVSALAVDDFTSTQTAQLLQQTREIMEQAERDGVNPDERLRQVVEQAVREGFNFGGGLGGSGSGGGGDDDPSGAGGETDGEKRSRH